MALDKDIPLGVKLLLGMTINAQNGYWTGLVFIAVLFLVLLILGSKSKPGSY